jgi:hypothetical protein
VPQTRVWTGPSFPRDIFSVLMHCTSTDVNVNSGRNMSVNVQKKFTVIRQAIHPLAGAKPEPLSNCAAPTSLETVKTRTAVFWYLMVRSWRNRHQCFEGACSVHFHCRRTVFFYREDGGSKCFGKFALNYQSTWQNIVCQPGYFTQEGDSTWAERNLWLLPTNAGRLLSP